MKKLCKQIISFLLISGTGWIIDFGLFILLTRLFDFDVAYANMISCIPALTFVFFIATHKVFLNKKTGLALKWKYVIYFAYQMVLIFCVSLIAQLLFNVLSVTSLMQYAIIAQNLKLLCKIVITPITMTVNFFVMKLLTEKL